MKIIGLTGSIAMGKSQTAKMFAEQDIPVFDSDQAVHQLLATGGAAVELVDNALPGNKKDNQIDRILLGKCVFNNDAALKKLENILHPMVQKKRDVFLKRAGIMAMILSCLIFRYYLKKTIKIIVIISSLYLRLAIFRKNVLERAGMTESKFLSILKKQMPDQEKRRRADFIILTDRGMAYARKQVGRILKEIRNVINA